MNKKVLLLVILLLGITGCGDNKSEFGNDVSEYLKSDGYTCKESKNGDGEILKHFNTYSCSKEEKGLTYIYEVTSDKSSSKYIALMIKEDDIEIKINPMQPSYINITRKGNTGNSEYQAIDGENVFSGKGVKLGWPCDDKEVAESNPNTYNKLYRSGCEAQVAYLNITNRALNGYIKISEKFNSAIEK